MSDVKFKRIYKYKSGEKCNLVQKHLSHEGVNSTEHKFNYRDCANEIFAGLMWSG